MKNRFLILMISLLLCAAMVYPALAEATVLQLPQKLVSIEKEAFANTEAVEKVIVQKDTKAIGSRAFANSAVREIYLPESVESIADDAFVGCENLTLYVPKGSYAHKWAAFSNVEYVVLSDEEPAVVQYSLSGLGTDGSAASVYVTAAEACVLHINVLSEADESLIHSLTGEIKAGLQAERVRLAVLQSLPEHFILEAVLKDADGNVLCKPVRDIRHTRAYAASQAAKPSDYPADRVLDFGEAGFAVLAENVIRVAGETTVSGSRYSIPVSALARSGSAISAGDVLLLRVNGVDTPVKAASVAIGSDGTLSVEADSEIKLADAYDKLSVNGYVKSDGSAGAEVGNVFNYKETFKYGKNEELTVAVDAGMSITVNAQYDKHVIREDYFLFDLEGKVWGNTTATLTGEYATKPDEIKLDLYKGKVIIPGVNLPADLTVTLPVNASVKGTGRVIGNFEKLVGFSWDTDNGFVKKQEPDQNYIDAHLQVNFHADTGPEVELDVGLWEFFGAKVSAQVGLDGDGTMSGKAHAGYVPPVEDDEIHACDLCLNLDVDIFAKANANIYYNITKKVSGDLLDEEIFYVSGDLLEKHWSIINEKESIYKGAATWGDGPCPNYKYRVNVSTVDINDKAVSGLPVSITGSNGSSASLVSPDKVHLYDADYTAEASFKSGASQMAFSVTGGPRDVVVKEEEMTIEGTVTDNKSGKPIYGARVDLTLPDGKVRTDYTNEEGYYKFDKLLGGTYSISFTKADYRTKTVSNMKYANGSRNKLNVGLVASSMPVITAEIWNESKRVQALAEDGTCPDGAPKVFLDVQRGDYHIEKVTVDYEGCAENPVIANLVADMPVYIIGAELFGVDMGNGEYTFVLELAHSGTGGGYSIVVFRENGGELEIIKQFTHKQYDDSISLNGSFSSDTHFSGVIMPTNTRFSGTMPLPYSSFNRVGMRFSAMGGSYMSYKKNQDGAYDLTMRTRYTAGGYNWDNIGYCETRYVMQNDKLVLQSQIFDVCEGGTVTYP